MGEFNVNKSDGSLEQTAGMPSEYPATQVMLPDGVTSVEDKLDALTDEIGLKIKYFDVTAPSGSSNYDFSNNKPSDFYYILSAMSIGGAAAIISQIGASKMFFYNTLSGNSVIRIMYVAE